MYRRPNSVIGILLSGCVLAGPQETQSAPPGYAIQNVTVIDVEAAKRRPNSTVLIEGASIKKIGAAADVAVPEGYERVDGNGKFLIPGLFDAHVHYVDPATYGPLCIAHGVTFVRDMGGYTDQIIELRDELNSGKKLGPEVICTGAIIDGKPPVWPFSEVCDTPEEGREAVKELVAAGVNQIKVYSRLKLDVYQAIAEESKKQNIKFVGHIPEAVTLDEAMKAGQYTNEHLMGFGRQIARMASTPAPDVENAKDTHFGIKAWSLLPKVERKTLDEFTKRVAASRMVQCPTLIVHEGISKVSRAGEKEDVRMKYVSPHMKSFWESAKYRDFSEHLTGLEQMGQMVGELHKAGAKLIVGTDLANPNVFAGFAVHEEMELFAKAGISPGEVLKAATINSARVCGVDQRHGTVAEGKTASLVLLRADPLEKVGNAREIDSVFLRGQYFDRAALDGLMVKAEQEASGSTPTPAKMDVKVGVPGEVVAKGVYKVSFNKMDSGTEEFAIGKDADGYHLMNRSLPKGGWEKPSVLKMRYDAKFQPVSAEWQQFGDVTTIAKYTVKDRKVHVEATGDGKPAGEQDFDLPEGAIFGGPAVAGEFFVNNASTLKVGESREYPAASFGFQGWRVGALNAVTKRTEDEKLTAKDGSTVTARHYVSTMDIPGLGPTTSETWCNDRGVALKSTFKMPFGTVAWELE